LRSCRCLGGARCHREGITTLPLGRGFLVRRRTVRVVQVVKDLEVVLLL
jgi:hypothetical protein